MRLSKNVILCGQGNKSIHSIVGRVSDGVTRPSSLSFIQNYPINAATIMRNFNSHAG